MTLQKVELEANFDAGLAALRAERCRRCCAGRRADQDALTELAALEAVEAARKQAAEELAAEAAAAAKAAAEKKVAEKVRTREELIAACEAGGEVVLADGVVIELTETL